MTSQQWQDRPIREFLDKMGDNSPAPGGGAAAGLTGAQACALAEMVCSLTISNEKYKDIAAEAAEWKELCRNGRSIMLDLMDEDAKNFLFFMEALRLPKETESEKESRKIVVQTALKKAIEAPYQMADTMNDLLELFTTILIKGNRSALTDIIIALQLAQASMRASFLNIQINLKSITDDFYKSDIEGALKEWEEGIAHVDALLTYQVKI